jgi:hypothetical protein
LRANLQQLADDAVARRSEAEELTAPLNRGDLSAVYTTLRGEISAATVEASQPSREDMVRLTDTNRELQKAVAALQAQARNQSMASDELQAKLNTLNHQPRDDHTAPEAYRHGVDRPMQPQERHASREASQRNTPLEELQRPHPNSWHQGYQNSPEPGGHSRDQTPHGNTSADQREEGAQWSGGARRGDNKCLSHIPTLTWNCLRVPKGKPVTKPDSDTVDESKLGVVDWISAVEAALDLGEVAPDRRIQLTQMKMDRTCPDLREFQDMDRLRKTHPNVTSFPRFAAELIKSCGQQRQVTIDELMASLVDLKQTQDHVLEASHVRKFRHELIEADEFHNLSAESGLSMFMRSIGDAHSPAVLRARMLHEAWRNNCDNRDWRDGQGGTRATAAFLLTVVDVGRGAVEINRSQGTKSKGGKDGNANLRMMSQREQDDSQAQHEEWGEPAYSRESRSNQTEVELRQAELLFKYELKLAYTLVSAQVQDAMGPLSHPPDDIMDALGGNYGKKPKRCPVCLGAPHVVPPGTAKGTHAFNFCPKLPEIQERNRIANNHHVAELTRDSPEAANGISEGGDAFRGYQTNKARALPDIAAERGSRGGGRRAGSPWPSAAAEGDGEAATGLPGKE